MGDTVSFFFFFFDKVLKTGKECLLYLMTNSSTGVEQRSPLLRKCLKIAGGRI